MISGTRFLLNVEIARQRRLAEDIARGQVEISTHKKILAPSDDPIGAARVAEITRSQGNEATWLRNVETASALASLSDTRLASLVDSLDQAKELMIKANSGTVSAADRTIIAAALRGIAEEVAALRDTRDSRGEPLFRANGALEVPVSPGLRIAPVPTRNSIFDAPADLIAIINAAASAAVEPDATRAAAVGTSLTDLEAAAAQVITARADQGIRADRLDEVKERLENSKIDLIEQKFAIEGADIAEVIARTEARMTSLQAAQAIFARMNKSSLFDLI